MENAPPGLLSYLNKQVIGKRSIMTVQDIKNVGARLRNYGRTYSEGYSVGASYADDSSSDCKAAYRRGYNDAMDDY